MFKLSCDFQSYPINFFGTLGLFVFKLVSYINEKADDNMQSLTHTHEHTVTHTHQTYVVIYIKTEHFVKIVSLDLLYVHQKMAQL